KRHGQPEPRNGYTAGGCPTRGAERGTAGGDGLRASGSVRTVPLFDRRHESVSRRDDDAVAQAVASPTFLVIALRWSALRWTPTGEKGTCGLMPPGIELSPTSHATSTVPG